MAVVRMLSVGMVTRVELPWQTAGETLRAGERAHEALRQV